MIVQRSFVFMIAVGTALGGASSQQDVTAPPVLSVHTDLVTLPVTVVDPEGGFVTGLRQEHFTVYDNSQPQHIEFFSSDDLPVTVGLVIDCSASMQSRRTEIAAAVTAFAAMSHPLDEFFTVNFNEHVWLGLAPPLAFTQDADQLRAALARAPSAGMTALHDGVDRGLAHLRNGTRDRRALIVVSDGGDNASLHTVEEVVEQARMAGAPIYSVTVFDPNDHAARPRLLKTLARETGGRVFTPRNTAEVMAAFAQIAREIRAGYTIGFVPAETTAASFHVLRVLVDTGTRRGLTARTRAGYYAGPRSSHR
jgi:Ca-activated chloride channel family protein